MDEQTTQPKIFTLAGKELMCYQAGEQIGSAKVLAAAAQDTLKYRQHLHQQLAGLRHGLLKDKTYPIPDDHPMKTSIDALLTLVEPLGKQVEAWNAQAQNEKTQGTQILGRVAVMETTSEAHAAAKEAAWRPTLRAWGMLTMALVPAVVVATIVSTLAARLTWW